jgi:hypothetical protein
MDETKKWLTDQSEKSLDTKGDDVVAWKKIEDVARAGSQEEKACSQTDRRVHFLTIPSTVTRSASNYPRSREL